MHRFGSHACRRHVYGRHVAKMWQALVAKGPLGSLLLFGLTLGAVAGPAGAQPAAAPTHIAAELVAQSPAVVGGPATLALHMTPAPGWHGYWLQPGDAGFAMRLTWHLPTGASVGALRYPVPQTLLIAGLMNHVYEQDYAVLADLHLPQATKPGIALPVRVSAQWLACSATVCVPEAAELATSVATGAARGSDPRFDRWRAALPAPLGAPAHFAVTAQGLSLAIPLPASVSLASPHLFVADDAVVDPAARQDFFRDHDTLVVRLARAKFPGALPQSIGAVLRMNAAGDGLEIAATPGPVPAGGIPLSDGSPASAASLAPLPLLLLAALAGGLLLNVMPCVFPILSLKALSLARAGESEAEARAEGLAYSAGVILACTALGAALLALRAGGHQLGWAFQLQEPGVVVALLLLACAITANLAGLFEFAVPGFVQGGIAGPGNAKRGAFATGLLAAFVATPCTGPFMASAMGAALLLPTGAGLALFATLGLGLALPFLGIACVPPLRRLLPRPGAWMVWFRKIMALPLGLTALALVWLAGRLGGQGYAAGAGALALALVVALGWVGACQRRGLPVSGRVSAVALGLAVGAGIVLPRAYQPVAPVADSAETLPSQPFSQAALDAARASGHPVFAYFTADWCLTCKVNEAVAIERPSTRAAFQHAGVVVLKGDWTRRDPAITGFLNAQGAGGVPLYLWYPVGGNAVQLPQILNPSLLAGLPRGTRDGR